MPWPRRWPAARRTPSCSRATCGSSAGGAGRARRADPQHAPVAAAGVSGRPRGSRCPRRTACAVTGATVHLVDETLDGGPIVAQEAVADPAWDDETSLHERIKAVEHRLLPRAVALLLAGALSVDRAVAASRIDLNRAAPRFPSRAGRCSRSPTRPASWTWVAASWRPRVRAGLDRRHRPRAPRGRAAGHRCRRRHGLAGDARRPGQDAPPAGPRRHPRRPPPRRPPRALARRYDRPIRARRRQPLPLRGRRRAARDDVDELIEEIDIGGPRWSGRPPRTTPASRS